MEHNLKLIGRTSQEKRGMGVNCNGSFTMMTACGQCPDCRRRYPGWDAETEAEERAASTKCLAPATQDGRQ